MKLIYDLDKWTCTGLLLVCPHFWGTVLQSLQSTDFCSQIWCSLLVFWLDLSSFAYDWVAYVVVTWLSTQMKSSPITKLFDYINFFRKNLCFVGSATLCSKSEAMLPFISIYAKIYLFQNWGWMKQEILMICNIGVRIIKLDGKLENIW